MTDDAQAPAGAKDEAGGPPLVFLGQYIKDLSFEVPNAPEIFARLSAQPDIPIHVDVQARPVQDDKVFEVVLHFTINATVDGQAAFMLEVAYGAIVQVNPPEPNLRQPLVLIEAPRMMFPFVRSLIADITRDGGFPPLLLQPIDFVQLYRQRLDALAAQQAQGTA